MHLYLYHQAAYFLKHISSHFKIDHQLIPVKNTPEEHLHPPRVCQLEREMDTVVIGKFGEGDSQVLEDEV